MNLLFDLDCLSKLHVCSAFHIALDLFPQGEKQCFYVDTFPHTASGIAKKHEKNKKHHLASVFQKIADRSLLTDFDVIKARIDDAELLAQLQYFPGIDPGEALLLLNTFRMENSLLLTGDGRFLTAVVENEKEIRKLIPNFNKQFIFFLNIVEKICKNNPERISLFSVEHAWESDQGLKAIFGGNPTVESISDATISYTRKFSVVLHSLDF